MKQAKPVTSKPSSVPFQPRKVAARLAASAAAGCALTAAPFDAGAESGLSTRTIANADRLDTTTTGRGRAPDAPEPLRFGNFYVAPELLTSTSFDNNIFRTATGQRSDVRIEVVPVINVTSKLPRHEINFLVAGKLVSLVENDDQNYQDIGANFSGALHIDHAHTLAVNVLSELKHEEKGLTLTPHDAKRPVPYIHNRAAAGLTRDVGRLFGTVSVSADRFDYQDVETIDNEPLDQDNRDTDLFTAQLRAGYRFSPGFEFVGQLKALRQLNEGSELYSSQSTGYEATAGLQFQTSPLLKWHLLGGWGVRDFDRADMATLQSSLIEGGVEWLPTDRMTIKGAIARNISADTAEDGIGSVQTSINAGLDYEIFHNLVAHAGMSVSEAEFTTSDRRDTTYGASLGLDYYFTKNAAFTLGYKHETRDSTIEANEMTRDVVTVGAKLRF